MATIASLVQCPGAVCTCGGTETVTVKAGTSRGRATLAYSPCANLIAQGWTARYSEVVWA